jgi:hypothetical protein
MIAEFESRILALIDDMVEHASDDELFASGYLRGHLTLAVAELEAGDDHSADAVHDEVTRSLEKAIQAGELSRATSLWCWACGTLCSSRLNAKSSYFARWRCAYRAYILSLRAHQTYLTIFPFSSFRTHNRFGFSPQA